MLPPLLNPIVPGARQTLTRLAVLGTLSRSAGEGGTSPHGLVGEGPPQAIQRRITAAISSGLSSSARWPAPGIMAISVRPAIAAAKRSV